MGIVGTAHVGVCVQDIDEAVGWYRDVLGMTVLSPPYLMEGPDIERDMGEMIPGVKLKGAIVGFGPSDHVLELIEYPDHPSSPRKRTMTDTGISHIG
jgi:catechol 2,3-dioxygenase-like lactoylglutathione lyase family enzyme